MSKAFNQYFSHYAESEVDVLMQFELLLPDDFSVSNVVVIPAYNETSAFIERFLDSSLSKDPVLMVVVINSPIVESLGDFLIEASPNSLVEYAENQLSQNNNSQQLLHDYSISCGTVSWHYDNLTLVKVDGNKAWLLVVDRFTQGIDKEQGVGLARKIGSDLSAYLISINRVKQQWICSSDADAYLPDDYFSVLLSRNNKTAVCCFNFMHSSENESVHQANFLYETALRYYVAGLHYANSPYAFFTIGSTLAFTAEVYAQARGFPKRSAGEDFYLLNKLAKLGNVEFIENVIIKLEARTSQRVPFGSGPAVQKILDLQKSNQDYCYYHPELFTLLKSTLYSFSNLWEYRSDLTSWFAQLPTIINPALIEIGFETFVEKQRLNSKKQFDKQLIVWFDAFKTLKFIHNLRANHFQDIPLSLALSKAPFNC